MYSFCCLTWFSEIAEEFDFPELRIFKQDRKEDQKQKKIDAVMQVWAEFDFVKWPSKIASLRHNSSTWPLMVLAILYAVV